MMRNMMTKPPTACLLSQRGLATLEFALCAPVLLLLMLATAEIGRVFFQYNSLNKQVRDAVRYAATNAGVGSTRVVNITTAVRDASRNLVVYGNTAGTGVVLLPGLTTGNVTVGSTAAGYVSITANYVYQPMVGGTLPVFGLGNDINLNFTLDASVWMRAL